MLRNQKALLTFAVSIAASATLGLYVVAIVFDVISRTVFGSPIHLVSDLSEILIPLALGLTFPAATMQGTLLAITFLGDYTGPRVSRFLNIMARVITAAFLTLIPWMLVKYAHELYLSGRATAQFGLPLYPLWYVIAGGFALSVIGLFFVPLDKRPALTE